MKFSIISPSYNQAEYIEETIISVLSQNHENVEHIVIDGGSKDGTVEILKKYPHLIWVSEKDKGQTDALNKGFGMATGDIIGWVNSDDFYEPDIFQIVESIFVDQKATWVIGKQPVYFDETREIWPDTTCGISHKALLDNPDCLRQAPTFFRKDILEKFLPLKTELHMTMDLELWLRIAKTHQPVMVDQIFAYLRIQKNQKTNGANTRLQLKEMLEIFRKEGATRYQIANLLRRKLWYILKWELKHKYFHRD